MWDPNSIITEPEDALAANGVRTSIGIVLTEKLNSNFTWLSIIPCQLYGADNAIQMIYEISRNLSVLFQRFCVNTSSIFTAQTGT